MSALEMALASHLGLDGDDAESCGTITKVSSRCIPYNLLCAAKGQRHELDSDVPDEILLFDGHHICDRARIECVQYRE